MSLTLPNTSLGTGVVDPTPIEENFSSLATKFGNIDNSDIASSAGISLSKLAGRYEHLALQFNVPASFLSAGAGYKAWVPLPDDGKGDWSVVGASYYVEDSGSGDAIVSIEWGYRNASGWQITSTPIATETIPNLSVAQDNNNATMTVDSATLSNSPAQVRSLALRVTTVGTGYGTGSTDLRFYCTVFLKRDIST